MYRSILVATDGSPLANLAVEHAAGIARACRARMAIVTVSPPLPAFDEAEIGTSLPANIYDRMRKSEAAKAIPLLRQAKARAATYKRSIALVHIAEREPYAGIIEAADEFGADLIVIAASSKKGIDYLLLGSQTMKVLKLAKVPVLVIKHGEETR